MAFDVQGFLTNLSSPQLRESLLAQKEQERERAKEFDKNVGYLDAAGIMSKDAAKTRSAAELRQIVESDTVKRKIGEHALQTELHNQQIDQLRRKKTEAAVAQAFDYMRQQQQRGNIPNDPMAPMEGGPATGAPANVLTNPGMMLPGTAGGDPGQMQQLPVTPGQPPGVMSPMDRQDQMFDAFTRYPKAFNSELGREIATKANDPFRAKRLEIEAGQLKVNEAQLKLEQDKAAKGGGKTYAEMPGNEEQARLWRAGKMVIQNEKGGWDTVNVDTEKKMDTGTLLAVLSSGGDLKKLLEQPKSNPFEPVTGKKGASAPGKGPAPTPADIQYLKLNPAKRAGFEKRFGPGSADQYLK